VTTSTASTDERIALLENQLSAYVLMKRLRAELHEIHVRERAALAELDRLRVLLTRADHPLGPIEETP
jgi:hypothetical protein